MSAASAEAVAPAVGQKRSRPEEIPTAPVPDVLMLPGASIMRIVKSKLPDGVMVGSETKKAFGKACSLFILYLTTMCVHHQAAILSRSAVPPRPCQALTIWASPPCVSQSR